MFSCKPSRNTTQGMRNPKDEFVRIQVDTFSCISCSFPLVYLRFEGLLYRVEQGEIRGSHLADRQAGNQHYLLTVVYDAVRQTCITDS
jgi:hypothetical protein